MSKTSLNQDELYFKIADVAHQIGIVPATIRNWEKQGLFQAKRSEKGYRVYDLDDIEQLRSIKQLSKDKSMGINAIRMFRRRNPEETGRAGAGGREAVVSKRL
ncbi:MAG: MerR family transcriptional regulator, partial [Candidatus Adiutrix sp.]|nr:MerR family transcriptional regulator [Candidatus Adiutrix sp.]